MLTGNHPFGADQHENFLDLCHSIISQPYQPPSKCTVFLLELLESMLNKDPKHRFTISQCMNHEWFIAPIFKYKKHSLPFYHKFSKSKMRPISLSEIFFN